MINPTFTRKDYVPKGVKLKKHERIKPGDTFGRLTVQRFATQEDLDRLGRKMQFHSAARKGSHGPRIIQLCKCVCGKECAVESHDLTRGSTVSCGCYGREVRKILIDKTQQPRILYRDYAFRSSWELVFALFCEKNQVRYDYEPRWFPVMVDGSECDYKPDFFLTDLNLYVEIKGRVHGNAVKKFRRFANELAKAYILFEDSIRAMLKVTLHKWTKRALLSLKDNVVDLRNSPELVAELKEYIAPFNEVFEKINSRYN